VPSYKEASRRLTRQTIQAPYDGVSLQGAHLMNTIIYIVGLVVVIGVILSFFGLR
jgi:hypothetical protein